MSRVKVASSLAFVALGLLWGGEYLRDVSGGPGKSAPVRPVPDELIARPSAGEDAGGDSVLRDPFDANRAGRVPPPPPESSAVGTENALDDAASHAEKLRLSVDDSHASGLPSSGRLRSVAGETGHRSSPGYSRETLMQRFGERLEGSHGKDVTINPETIRMSRAEQFLKYQQILASQSAQYGRGIVNGDDRTVNAETLPPPAPYGALAGQGEAELDQPFPDRTGDGAAESALAIDTGEVARAERFAAYAAHAAQQSQLGAAVP